MPSRIGVCVYTYTHTYTYTYTYICEHTCTRTRAHTQGEHRPRTTTTQQNVFSSYRMCSLTIECVLFIGRTSATDHHHPTQRASTAASNHESSKASNADIGGNNLPANSKGICPPTNSLCVIHICCIYRYSVHPEAHTHVETHHLLFQTLNWFQYVLALRNTYIVVKHIHCFEIHTLL